jgi:CheY-like chemotaxis protein
VLTNLVSNAIKFTERGSVTLRVGHVADSGNQVTLRFDVKDTGIGVSPEQQRHLFSPFAQADASTTRRFGGTGLGLSIVKRLAEMMGGEAALSSVPGVGSTFSVTITFDRTSVRLASMKPAATDRRDFLLLGVRVLVVDDSEINLEVARRILEQHGAVVSCASNGQQAIDRLKARSDAFDIVLMDVQMPVLDGHAATRRIRSELGMTRLPIIALTADARSSERKQCLAMGMDDFVSKPFEPKDLVRTMLLYVSPGTSRPRPSAVAALPAVPAEAQWPAIDGIDSDDVRLRLGGDVALFGELLAKFREAYADLAVPAERSEPLELRSLGARAHGLRGAAGALGAREIYELAGKLEAACREGATRRAAPLLPQLSVRLQRLFLTIERAGDLFAPPPESDGPDDDQDPQCLERLLELLREQNLAVLDHVSKNSSSLRGLLGSVTFDRLRNSVQGLRFDEAITIIQGEAPTDLGSAQSASRSADNGLGGQ